MLPSFRTFLQSLRAFPRTGPLPSKIPDKVVIIRTDNIGDHIVFGGFFELLARAWPQTQMTLVGPASQREIYKFCPWIKDYLSIELGDKKSRTEAYRQIRRRRPDWIINPTVSRSPASDRFVRYCHAPVRLGWSRLDNGHDHKDTTYFDAFYTHQFPAGPWPTWLPEREKNRLFLQHLGVDATDVPPTIWTGPDDAEAARRIYDQAHFRPEQTAVCFLGASNSLRSPPQLKSYLARVSIDFDLNIVMVGTARDHALSERPAEFPIHRWRNLCGETSLQQTAELMRLSRLVIGVNSGPAHLAEAVGAPHVIAEHGMMFGRFLPASSLTSLVIVPLECYHCQENCRFDRPYCLTELPYAPFRQAVGDALQTKSGRARIYRQTGKFLDRLPPGVRTHWDPAWINPVTTELVTVPKD